MKIKYILLAAACLLSTALNAQPLSQRVNFPVIDTGRDSMDISWLNNGPAGKNGFISVTPDGHFADSTGRVKFLGVAIAGPLCFPDKNEADAIAAYFAKNGINIVRLHFFMNGLLSKNPKNAEKSLASFDYFLHALMQRGIYIDLDLYDLYQVSPPGYAPEGGGRFKTNDFYYYSKAIDAQKYYAAFLFNHVNPHTGHAYKDEPGIAFVELLNENTPFWQDGLQKADGDAKAELETLFIDWVQRNKVPESLYKPLLTDAAHPLEKGNITFGSVFDSEAMKRFAIAVMTRYNKGMKDYLKTLGVRIPITGHNSPFTAADFSALSGTMDYTCSHFYWTHTDLSSLKMPLNHFWTLPAQLIRARVASMAAIVNEFSYSHPNKYRSEGLAEAIAYGGLQDLDALVLFSFHDEWPKFLKNGKPTTASWKNPNQKIRYHSNLVKDPAIWPLVPALALSFRQTFVKPAANTLRLTYNRAEVSKLEVRERDYTPAEIEAANPDRFGSRQLLASSEATYKKLPALVRGYDTMDIVQLLAFTTRVEREFDKDPGGILYAAGATRADGIDAKNFRITYLPDANNADFEKNYASLRASLDAKNIKLPLIENSTIRSDTGEISRNFERGTLRVETPRAITASGFIQGENRFLGGALALTFGNEHITAAVVSGDKNELSNTATVYVCFGVNAANTNQQPTAGLKDFHIGTPYNDGDAPILADALDASLTWNRAHKGYRVYAEQTDTAEYKLLKEEKSPGPAVTVTFQKNAYRYKIVFE